jgi:hypothetical protein
MTSFKDALLRFPGKSAVPCPAPAPHRKDGEPSPHSNDDGTGWPDPGTHDALQREVLSKIPLSAMTVELASFPRCKAIVSNTSLQAIQSSPAAPKPSASITSAHATFPHPATAVHLPFTQEISDQIDFFESLSLII